MVYLKTYKKGEVPMKLKISIPEVVSIFKEIKEQPEQLYEMVYGRYQRNKGIDNSRKWQAPVSWKID